MGHNQGVKSKNVTRPGYRTGASAKAARPAGVAQIGLSYGTHITEKRKESSYRGEAVFGGGDVMASKFGNEIAATTKCGVGGSRTIFKSGSQHGLQPARPPAKGRSLD